MDRDGSILLFSVLFFFSAILFKSTYYAQYFAPNLPIFAYSNLCLQTFLLEYLSLLTALLEYIDSFHNCEPQ